MIFCATVLKSQWITAQPSELMTRPSIEQGCIMREQIWLPYRIFWERNFFVRWNTTVSTIFTALSALAQKFTKWRWRKQYGDDFVQAVIDGEQSKART